MMLLLILKLNKNYCTLSTTPSKIAVVQFIHSIFVYSNKILFNSQDKKN